MTDLDSRPTMTVGELREQLRSYPDDRRVYVMTSIVTELDGEVVESDGLDRASIYTMYEGFTDEAGSFIALGAPREIVEA